MGADFSYNRDARNEEFLRILAEAPNEPEDFAPTPGSIMVEKARPRLNAMTDEEREHHLSGAMVKIYSSKKTPVESHATGR